MACPATIRMGYLGVAKIDGNPYFMTGSSLNAVQTVNAPDLVQGYYVRRGWNYGKVEAGGNLSGPCHDSTTGGSIGDLMDLATERDGTNHDHMAKFFPIDLAFYETGGGYVFQTCYANSLAITATAGDVANFTLDVMSCDGPDEITNSAGAFDDLACSKLVTWDKINVTGIDGASYFQAVNFTINNSLERQYAISDDNAEGLFPVDVTAGLQGVTGSISAYLTDSMQVNMGTTFVVAKFGADKYGDYTESDQQTVKITVGDEGEIEFKAQFHRPEASSQTGAQIVTLNFTGVCDIS